MAEIVTHLDVYTNIAKTLVLKFVNSHSKCRVNKILPLSQLIKNCHLLTYTTFVVFRLQQYTRYHNLHIYSTVANDFRFNIMLINIYNLSSCPIIFNRRLKVVQYYD